MSFQDHPRSPKAPVALPTVPADGTIVDFVLADAVGTIRLSDDSEVRFGRSACDFEPVVGLDVRVLGVAPGPFGRVRATRVERRTNERDYERLLDARDRAAGLPARRFDSGPDALARAKLSVTTTRPLVDRTALREMWHATGCDRIAKLDFVPSPVAEIERRRFQIVFGAGLAPELLDTRFRPAGRPLGEGFVGFWEGLPSLARNPALGPTNAWGFGSRGSARLILGLVAHLARAREWVAGVVVGSAGAMWLEPDAWLRRVGDPADPGNVPVEAFVDVAYGPEVDGVRLLRSFGMTQGLALPDVEIDDPYASRDDARHALCVSLAWAVCRTLAGEEAIRGVPPESSLPVGARARVRLREGVVGFGVRRVDDDPDLLRLVDVRLEG